ncbi:PorP/SprF family type IX secretion system membrane protein [Carboxylicivirga caseinilyticus]|uniref:PorP/SprF family type IX secretion system membrane protein n=1 Tax=Carboxylicivirga caseinilyticus TaxID=3417572 RepID=UPI003D33DA3B|nr:type IX secretion system membrane protein PorP/SprF [Marinilabiliaceae bacterium A049]
MNKIAKLLLLFLTLPTIAVFAQKDIVMSQYMHNRYTINSAFAGNREAISLFGSYRQKWVGFNGAPSEQYLSGHAPLRNKNIALGIDIYNQQYGVTRQTGASFSYTYRVLVKKNQRLSFGLNAGFVNYNSNWTSVKTLPEFGHDSNFSSNESAGTPTVGLGIAWYSNQFFIGLSAPNFMYFDIGKNKSEGFAPGKSNYIFTGGYSFKLSEKFDIQPSILARYNPQEKPIVDLNCTTIFNNIIWLGASVRNNLDIVGLVGYQVTPQMRFAYSYDYSAGDYIKSYNSGTHEISIQFDFGYKISTPNPKFF